MSQITIVREGENNMNEEDIKIHKIHELLFQLGIASSYVGFHYVTRAILYLNQQPEIIIAVTKKLYPKVAEYYKINTPAVERNIRTIINVAWTKNPDTLNEFCSYKLDDKPATAEFIAILERQLNGECMCDRCIYKLAEHIPPNLITNL